MSQINIFKKERVSCCRRCKKNVLKLRAKLDANAVVDTICLHHKYLLDTGYSTRQKKCLDPLKDHKKPITKCLKIVGEAAFQENTQMKHYVVPGDKLCLSCYKKLSKQSIDVLKEKVTIIPGHKLKTVVG